MNSKWSQSPEATNQCNDEVKVVTSPMAAEDQSDYCATELGTKPPQDEVQEGFNLAGVGLLFLVALSMGIAPGLVQLGFVVF